MSTIKANTLLHSDGSTTTQPSIPALDKRMAKAWVNYDQKNTVGIRDSYGVSSVTDFSTGIHLVNFSTAMTNANYAVSVTFNGSGVVGAGGSCMNEQNQNTTGFARNLTYNASTLVDVPCIHTIIFSN